MLPRWHILLGAVFTVAIWIFSPEIPLIYLALIFLSSLFIDFDHYLYSLIKTKKWRLKDAFQFYKILLDEERREIKQGIKRKTGFFIFHTIEFHLLLGLLGIYFDAFLYLFIGMIFHSLLDVIDLIHRGALHRREYFFFNWLRKKI